MSRFEDVVGYKEGTRDITRYLGADVIFKYLRERRDGRKNAKVGVLLAIKSMKDGEVYIGFSKCHSKEKFNLLDGLKMAEFRALDKSNPSMPIKHARDLANFVDRSKRYFKGVSVFHYPMSNGHKAHRKGIFLREANKTSTECDKCNSHKDNGCNTLSGKEKGGFITRKMIKERAEKRDKSDKDLMPEMMDSIMEEIDKEEKASTECKDDSILNSIVREIIEDRKKVKENTRTECTCKCGDMSDSARKEWAKTELEREKEKFNKKFGPWLNMKQEPDIAKVLDDSFRDKGFVNGIDYTIKPKISPISIDYSKGYFTNAHMKDLDKRLKKVELELGEEIVATSDINYHVANVITELISRVEKLEVMHKVKSEDVKAEGVIDYAYVIRHNGKVNNAWDMPLSDYVNKYLVDEEEGIYSDDLDKAIKYLSMKEACDVIEEEHMGGYEEVVKVKRVGNKWIYWMVADGSW